MAQMWIARELWSPPSQHLRPESYSLQLICEKMLQQSLSTNGDILSISVPLIYCQYSIYWFRVGENLKSDLSNLQFTAGFFLYTLAICAKDRVKVISIYFKLD